MRRFLLLPVSICTALVAAGPPVGDVLAPAPSEGSREARFLEETAWQLDDFDMTFDGGRVESDLEEISGTARRVLEVTDRNEEVEGPRATRLLRSYDEAALGTTLAMEGAGELLELPTSSESAVEGLDVRFLWDADEEAYARELADGEDDPRLEGLTGRLDLAELLPEDEVAADDTWELDPELAALFLRPGGELSFEIEEIAAGSVFSIPTGAVAATSMVAFGEQPGDWSGELVGRYLGASDGVAELEYELDVSAEHDLDERFARALAAAEAPEEGAALTLEVELEGVLRLSWDLTAGAPVSWRFEGESALEATAAWNEALFDQEVAFEGTFETSGTTRIEGTYEAE